MMFNRLDSISYPDHPENNVKYVYGTKDEAGVAYGYRAGRLKQQIDGSGAQEFRYGKQGEITQVRRTLVIPNQAVATYTTDWTYDSWNRVQTMTYPDGEQLTYSYNPGGLLAAVSGSKNSETYPYVSNIAYDKFEQRTYMKYGNGAETNYTYDPLTRQLGNLQVKLGDANLMNNTYAYDAVSNVKSVTNTGTPANGLGGAMVHNYNYDDLYRLSSANGTFTGANGKTAHYTLAMGYDNLHNITSKKQDIEQYGVQFAGTLKAGYNLSYNYAKNPQQISNIADSTYRTEGTIVKTLKSQQYGYDANGNLLYVNTGTKTADGKLQATNSRKMLWDEENRLLALSDNGFVSNYWYDAAGERTVKSSGGGEGVSVNGIMSGGRTGTTNFTAYISPYLVVNNGGNYTKHIYIGSQRITSKVSNSGIFETSPVTTTALQTKYADLTSKIKTRYDSLGVAYKGTLQTGGLLSSNPSAAGSPYFYHSDHLGSSSLITDGAGAVTQHLEYVPFGEVFIDERRSASSWATPYLFSAKERDEETGLSYFGARYYDSKTSVWLSVDPLAEKYPNVSSYVYCVDNPLTYKDPDGRVIIPVHGTWSRTSTWKNLSGIKNACFNLFGDKKLGVLFPWSGGNYSGMRTEAATKLIKTVRAQLAKNGNSEPITLVGHSHGGNVSIEAINMMVKMDEFKDVKFNLLTINTPVRKDYQLSEEAQKRVNHVNVYDTKDPVQSNGGNSRIVLPENPSATKLTGESGASGRTFDNALNISVDNPQGFVNGWNINGGIQWGDYHNSHNRVNDWLNKTERK